MKNFEPLFLFINENITLFEIKRTDIPEDSPADQLYHWLTVSKDTPEPRRLTFVDMGTENINGNDINFRVFKEGELRFDPNFAKFILDNDGHIIMNVPTKDFPENLISLAQNYLKSL